MEKALPEATLSRMTGYLRALEAMREVGRPTISSEVLAAAAGVNSAILRKDLSLLGTFGTRGVGYRIEVLAETISETLGLERDWRVGILGAGNLGRALAGYAGFHEGGFSIQAVFDIAETVIGDAVGGLAVRPVGELAAATAELGLNMAVLAVPGPAAQELCDRVVGAGITNILSFAPVILQVPEGIHMRRVDMARELQILAYHAGFGAGRPADQD
ncbi:MAG: redox-sensing transcriptional repressor Rex [Arthrobacter sp.]|uniref:redox-sensing transcriptional repressor Rex n=1 Tax=Arthrobacter sp. AOP36-A1-22 TaxID=3457684 RepID=UPI00264D038A|nr:redox-sensing transcriptional repressor Rex [Micrococcaceae bacterium]MDN5885435.1 redox-sensing transcriptional repressor Rex [Micrococcaceae bacterium]MDN6179272.1 redox-sensing transcriptional repressor Rex [Micrococcaceae bacterium]MDN6298689.1 redox-sensing transcriptional repressor Rex [Micrococcaceae bacterium]